jgi:hypothetical protein
VRKYRENDDENGRDESGEVKVYKWKGRREQLIDEELSFIEKSLKQRRKEMEDVREVVRSSRRSIDCEIENLIFSMIVNQNSNATEESINAILGKTKAVVNESEQAIRKVVSKMSITLGS